MDLKVCLLLVVSRHGLRSGTAGNEDFHNGVAAQTVAAVDAAGNLTRSVKAGDRVAVLSMHYISLLYLISN